MSAVGTLVSWHRWTFWQDVGFGLLSQCLPRVPYISSLHHISIVGPMNTSRQHHHHQSSIIRRGEPGFWWVLTLCVCVCVCVWERERERERKNGHIFSVCNYIFYMYWYFKYSVFYSVYFPSRSLKKVIYKCWNKENVIADMYCVVRPTVVASVLNMCRLFSLHYSLRNTV